MIRLISLYQDRIFRLPFLKRFQKMYGTAVSIIPHQHRKAENDIFVLHSLTIPTGDRMKLSRKNSQNVSFLHRIRHCIHCDPPLSLLHSNNFHFFMPVKSHMGEIYRDRAGINIKRKLSFSMFLYFMVPPVHFSLLLPLSCIFLFIFHFFIMFLYFLHF